MGSYEKAKQQGYQAINLLVILMAQKQMVFVVIFLREAQSPSELASPPHSTSSLIGLKACLKGYGKWGKGCFPLDFWVMVAFAR